MAYGTLDELASYLTSGYWGDTGQVTRKWNLTDTGYAAKSGTLTYSTGSNWYDGDGISSNHAALVRIAFQYLGNITGINFVEVGDGSTADIAFGNENNGAYASVYDAYWDVYGESFFIDSAYVNVEPLWANNGSAVTNDYVMQTFIHEILHVLGLGHQSNYNGTASFPTDADFSNDNWQNSIMSYFSQSKNYNVDADFAFVQTAMAADLLALNELYGNQFFNGSFFGSGSTFDGDTIYGWNTNISASDDFIMSSLSENGSNAFCIVDSGGVDTLDCSGWSDDQLIDLTVSNSNNYAPTASNIGGLVGNLTLSIGTVIENAKGGSGNDLIIGNEYGNYLDGGAANDVLYGGAGDDWFDYDANLRGGSDTFYGGVGDDSFILFGSDIVVEYANEGFDTVYSWGSYSLTENVERLFLMGLDDIDGYASASSDSVLVGNNGSNILCGSDGNDTLRGNGGEDILFGGAGSDTFLLTFECGSDSVLDFVWGVDVLYFFGPSGELSDDLVSKGYSESDYKQYTLSDGSNLTLVGLSNFAMSGSIVISGTEREGSTLSITNTLADEDGLGSFSYQWLRDGASIDGATSSTYVLTQDDVGSEITVTVSYTDGFGTEESVTSAATGSISNSNQDPTGSIVISGTEREGSTLSITNTLADEDGLGSFSYQWLRDGASIDGATSSTYVLTQDDVGSEITVTVSYTDGFGTEESVTSAATSSVNYGSTLNRSSTTTLPEIAHVLNLTLQGASNINGYGNSNANTLRGNSGNNILDGKSGNDTLYGGNNNDKLYGGSGNDRSYGEAGNDSLYMDAGNDTLDGGSGTDWLYVTGSTNSVVNLAKTTGQNTGYGTDIIKNIENASGGSGVDKFYGTSGNNTLKGNNGNDLLYGQNGNDTLYGGNNNDKLYGGSGNDRSYGEAGNDSLYMDAGNDTLDGGSGTDWLYVTGSTNSVVNLAKTTGQNTGYGTDIIKNIENASGGSGVDKFYGTSGNNTLKGNNGNDLLYGQNGNDTLYGGSNNDTLYGGSGNDTLRGDAGRDILQGDAGKDTLYGGADADTFVFRTTSDSSASASSADIIRDFTRGSDKIDLHYIDASTKLSGNNAFTFDGTTSFGTSNEGDIYYKQFNNAGTSNDYTMVYIDTDNDTGTEMSIKLMGLHALTASDFIL